MHQKEYTRSTMRAAARPESNPDDPREWAWVEAAGKTLVLPDPYHKYWWVKILAESATENPRVGGSIPPLGTNFHFSDDFIRPHKASQHFTGVL